MRRLLLASVGGLIALLALGILTAQAPPADPIFQAMRD